MFGGGWEGVEESGGRGGGLEGVGQGIEDVPVIVTDCLRTAHS